MWQGGPRPTGSPCSSDVCDEAYTDARPGQVGAAPPGDPPGGLSGVDDPIAGRRRGGRTGASTGFRHAPRRCNRMRRTLLFGRTRRLRGSVIQTLEELERAIPFARRHMGPSPNDDARMLAFLGRETWTTWPRAVPESIMLRSRSTVPQALPEIDVLAGAARHGLAEPRMTSMIGLGYDGTDTPQVVLRKVREPSLVHGLHALPAGDLAGPPGGPPELPDDGLRPDRAADRQRVAARRGDRGGGGDDRRPARLEGDSHRFIVDADRLPADSRRLQTRAEPLGIEVVVADLSRRPAEGDSFGVLAPYPGARGRIATSASHRRRARARRDRVRRHRHAGARAAEAAGRDGRRRRVRLVQRSACRRLRRPARRLHGAARGSSGRCRAGSSACPSTPTARGHCASPCRRASSTSGARRRPANICTAQVLLAVMASMYAVYHGPEA